MIWLVLPVSDTSAWFGISSMSPICSPSFSFMGGVEKINKQINKAGIWEIFLQGHILSTAHLCAVPALVLWVGLKKYINK